MSRKKSYLYARYSSDNQNSASIDAQLRHMREFCEKNDIEIVGEYIDEAQSATTDNRIAFQEMMKDVRNDDIDYVIVHKLNRFARNRFDSAIYKKRLSDLGVSVIASAQPLDQTTPEGRMMEGIIESMDEFYSLALSAETAKGQKEAALKALHLGGRPAFGFDLDENRRLIPNDKAHIVKKIFDLRIQGYGYRRIAKMLTEMGYTSQTGNRFSEKVISEILTNKKYIGIFTATIRGEKIEIPNAHPAIISVETFEKAQKVKAARIKPRMADKELYFLTGKMICECGRPFTGGGYKDSIRNGIKQRWYYYKCSGRKNFDCNAKSINKAKVEDQVMRYIFKNILTDEKIDHIAELTEEQAKLEYTEPAEDIGTLKKERNELISQQKKLLKLYISSTMNQEILDAESEDLNKRINILDSKIKKAEVVKNDSVITKEEIKKALLDIRENYDKESQLAKKVLVDTFVNRVIVKEETIELTLKLDANELVGFEMEDVDVEGSAVAGTNMNYGSGQEILSPRRYPTETFFWSFEVPKIYQSHDHPHSL